MKTVILNSFLNSLVENSLVDSAIFDEESGHGAIVSDKETLPFSLKEKGFVVSGKDPLETYCPNPEASLVRILSARLFGVKDAVFNGKNYSGVTVYPTKVRSDGVVFSTANGKEFISSSSNTRVTLGLYDILYSRNADSSVLMLPELLPSGSDVVAIASQKFRDCFVSVKTESIMSGATTCTESVCITSGDVSKYVKINQMYGDNSKLGDAAPTAEQMAEHGTDYVLQNSKAGYVLSCKLGLDTGISYLLEEEVKPSFALVQSSVTAANGLISELDKGVIFSSEHREAIKNLRQQAKPVQQSTTLSYNEAESLGDRVADYWGVPVVSHKVKTVVWSY